MSEEILFGKGEENPFGEFFIGKSYLNILAQAGEVLVANVTFEPGCRNNWHIHHAEENGGQILLVTKGEGWYQEEGSDPVELKPGMVVEIKPNVKHWHGAQKDSWFSHIAIEVEGINTSNEWLEEVSDDYYNEL